MKHKFVFTFVYQRPNKSVESINKEIQLEEDGNINESLVDLCCDIGINADNIRRVDVYKDGFYHCGWKGGIPEPQEDSI